MRPTRYITIGFSRYAEYLASAPASRGAHNIYIYNKILYLGLDTFKRRASLYDMYEILYTIPFYTVYLRIIRE